MRPAMPVGGVGPAEAAAGAAGADRAAFHDLLGIGGNDGVVDRRAGGDDARTLKRAACCRPWLATTSSTSSTARQPRWLPGEEKYRDRLLGSLGEEDSERHLFHGASGTRGNLCIAPALQKFIAEEMAKESAVLKERRKAREERSVARPKKAGKGGESAG